MSFFVLGIYAVAMLTFTLVSLFIIYHIAKYSINPTLKLFMLSFFIIVSATLTLLNLSFFFSIDWSFLNNYFQF